MAKNAFEISDVLSTGWKGFSKNAVIFVVLALITFVCSFIVSAILSFLPYIAASIISMAVSSYFMLSMIKASLIAADGGTPDWGVLKHDSMTFIKFLVVSFIFSIFVSIGIILLVLPALFISAAFFPVMFIIAEKSDTPIAEVFSKAWNMTIPQIWPLLVFIIICIILATVGFLAFIIGALVAIPIIYIASAAVYKKLQTGAVPAEAAPSAAAQESSASATMNNIIK